MLEEENSSRGNNESGLPNNPSDETLFKDPDRRCGKDRRSGEKRRKTDDSDYEGPECRSGKERLSRKGENQQRIDNIGTRI